MANLSDLTRKEQVLEKLRENVGLWVDGPELANEEIGGSEGLRRLRDLKAEGYLIQERAHPLPGRAVHQYRLMAQTTVDGGTSDRIYVPPPRSIGEYLPSRPRQAAGPMPPRRSKEEQPKDWELESAIRSEYRCEFWIRNPKQRIIGTIALDFDKSRWFWSVKQPAYHGKTSAPRPEKTLATGIIVCAVSSDVVAVEKFRREAREEAKWAVEARVRELKEARSL